MQNRIAEAGQAPDLRPSRLSCAILVELIVVLVILAILAAILVPALLGWIDEAKKKQYVLDARNIYMACQAVADEGYAANALAADSDYNTLKDYLTSAKSVTRIGELSDIVVTDATSFIIQDVGTQSTTKTERGAYVIKKMKVTFPSSNNGTVVSATLSGSDWDVKEGTTAPEYTTS